MAKKRRYIVVPRTTGIKETGLKTGKRHLKFGTKTARWVDDPAEAREIDAHYGVKGTGDVWVEQDENLEWHDKHDGLTDGKMTGVHHYTFAGVDTSHFVKHKDGDEKKVQGVVYVWKDGGWKVKDDLPNIR